MVEIHLRTWSKRALEYAGLDSEKSLLYEAIDEAEKKLKPQCSSNSKFWTGAAEIAQLKKERAEVRRKISIRDFKGDLATFENTEKAKELFGEIEAAQFDKKLFARQANRLDTASDGEKSKRRSFMQLFTTSTLGLGIRSGQGKRDSDMQSAFRNACKDAYNSKHPDYPRTRDLWDPIRKQWIEENATKAAHLFAYRHGQDIMDAIFGQSAKSELFSPYNGLILSSAVEEYLDKGKIAIVPCVSDNPSSDELKKWNDTEPKEYKIRILDPKWEQLPSKPRYDSPRTWAEMDNEKLEFRSEFRPRARYLYFLYCVQILKKSWQEQKQGTLLTKEFQKLFWGTPGKYLPKNMLLALVEEMGHEYELLLEGAVEADNGEKEGEEEGLLVVTMANQAKPGEMESEDEEED